MADFTKAYAFTKAAEGGKSKNTSDNAARNIPPELGGVHTNMGVTWATYKDVCKRALGKEPTEAHFLNMTNAEARSIYEAEYFKIILLHRVTSEKMGAAIFDFAVHSGAKTAVEYLQKCLCTIGYYLKIDGVLGPITLDALNEATHNPEKHAELVEDYLKEREGYLKLCAEQKWIDGSLLQSLLARVWRLRKYVATL